MQLELRRKFGKPHQVWYFTCYVFDPKDRPASTNGLARGDEWGYVTYPMDFHGAPTDCVGVYRVHYEIDGVLVATDRFEVTPMPGSEV